MTETSSGAKVIGYILAAIILVPICLYHAWVGMILYNWFVPNAFSFMPALTFAKAVGLTFAVSYWFVPAMVKREESNKKALYYLLAYPIVTLAVAWLFRYFMGI